MIELGYAEEAKNLAIITIKSGAVIGETFVECVLRNHYMKESRNAEELHT